MSAGLYTGGFGPAGIDPVYPYTASQNVASTQALQYDPTIQGFVQNQDGTMPSINPIDQQVALALFVEAGSIPSIPTFGSTFRADLNRIAPGKKNAVAQASAKVALGTLLANNDIILVSVQVQSIRAGGSLVAVTYINLRDPAYNPNNPAVTATTLNASLTN